MHSAPRVRSASLSPSGSAEDAIAYRPFGDLPSSSLPDKSGVVNATSVASSVASPEQQALQD